MAINPNQLVTRKILDQIASGVAGVELDDLLQSINKELTQPLRMRLTNVREVTVDGIIVENKIKDNAGADASSGAGNGRKKTVGPIGKA